MSSNQPAKKPAPRLEGVDELSTDVFRALIDTMKLNGQAMSRRFCAAGAHKGQAAVLRVLDVHEGISQRQISEELHLTPPSVTAALQAAEKAGLVVRRGDETDQRLTRVYLTDEGRRAAEEQRTVLAGYVKETIAEMPAAERRELLRLLRSLQCYIEATTTRETNTA